MPTGVYEYPNRILGKVKSICKCCNKEITAHFSRKKEYCDRGCYDSYIKENKIIPTNCQNTGRTRFAKGIVPWNKGLKGWNSGEKNSSWKGGITRLYTRMRRTKLRQLGGYTPEKIDSVCECNINDYGVLTCVYCEKELSIKNYIIEHKIPISRGGDNSFENLTISCRSCNCKKNNLTFDEYIKKTGGN